MSKSKKDWLEIFEEIGLEVYYCNDYKFDEKSTKEIQTYVKKSLDKDHLEKLPVSDRKKITERWEKTMKLFNENLSYVGYSVILLRKRDEDEEVELFTSKTIN